MNGANVEKVYRLAAKRERDRERKRRMSKRYGNVRNMVHLWDFEATEAAEESPSWLSDNGAGVEAVIAACDGETGESRYGRLLRKARDHVRNKAPHLLKEFNLIIKNGSNREESIFELAKARLPERCAWAIAEKRYYRARAKLLRLFGA